MRDQLAAVQALIAKLARHPLLPADVARALVEVSVLLSLMVDEIEKGAKE